MASGYKDYRRTVAPEREIFGIDQIPVFEIASQNVLTTATTTILTYTIPVGYQFHILKLVVSCKYPGTQVMGLALDATYKYITHFDTFMVWTFFGDTIFSKAEGDDVLVIVENQDSLTIEFFATLTGFIRPINT